MAIQPFHKFVYRCPQRSYDYLERTINSSDISEEDLIQFCNDPIVLESIFIASPVLAREIVKWIAGSKKYRDRSRSQQLKNSILKYFIRISTRCTPFGLFAGMGISKYSDSDESKMVIAHIEKSTRHSRLDMNYSGRILDQKNEFDFLIDKIIFHPNSSIYRIGNEYRYVEYKTINGVRNHVVSMIQHTEYLELILAESKNGLTLDELANLLINDEITSTEAKEYIFELIENQILVWELENSTIGEEFLPRYLSRLEQLGFKDHEKTIFLREIQKSLQEIDQCFGNSLNKYEKLYSNLMRHVPDANEKYLIQTDLVITSTIDSISNSLPFQVSKCVDFLNRIIPKTENPRLDRFIQEFKRRYESRTIPLNIALDPENGISYGKSAADNDINEFIDDVPIPQNIGAYGYTANYSNFELWIAEKLSIATSNGDQSIVLDNEDLVGFNIGDNGFPDTMSYMVQLVEIDGKEKIYFRGGGSSGAANLMARFCYTDPSINEFVQLIVNKEEQMNSDYVIAEIAHFPDTRVGNILLRPSFRKHEIVYLSNSTKENDNKILIEDLTIEISESNEIILRSIKLNCKVLPKLTSAHNYSSNSLPIYNFLCDLQNYNQKNRMRFDYGNAAIGYKYLPRVEYLDFILHPAQWRLNKRDLENHIKRYNSGEQMNAEIIQDIRIQFGIPSMIQIIENDNKLLFNLENAAMRDLFLNIISKQNNLITLEEFLKPDDTFTNENGERYVNEILLSYYNDKK